MKKAKIMKKAIFSILLLLPLTAMGQTYTWFSKPTEIINISSLEVEKIWSSSEAIMRDENKVCYFVTKTDSKFSDGIKDGIKIRIQNSSEVIHIGTVTLFDDGKKRTLPIIQIVKKEAYTLPEIPKMEEPKPFHVVERTPSYPGGSKALTQYINTNINYPVDAEINNIQGRVIVNFVVECDGSISNVYVAKSVHPSLDEEAIRVISSMPKWIPGRHDGNLARVRCSLPVSFNIKNKHDNK